MGIIFLLSLLKLKIMKTQFADDSFYKSIKKLNWQEGKIYKTYSLFRYDLPHFFSNIWRFRKVLWNHQWWDYSYTLEALKTSLEIMEKGLHNGYEIAESRNKKIEKIRRAIQLIKNVRTDSYISMAENELGEIILRDWEFEDSPDNPGYSQLIENETEEEKIHNKKVFDRSREIEEKEWNELCDIIRGQDYSKFDKEIDFDKQYDGSGLKNWWD
jgi:hypothetical protein